MSINGEKKFSQKTILVIDDEKPVRDMYRIVLTRNLGCTVIEAEDPVQAFQLLDKHHIDAIVLDMIMPKINGKAALSRIRSVEKWKDIPVIISTSHAEKKLVLDLLQIGITDYAIKPVTPQLLVDKVVEVLERQEKAKR